MLRICLFENHMWFHHVGDKTSVFRFFTVSNPVGVREDETKVTSSTFLCDLNPSRMKHYFTTMIHFNSFSK